MQVDVALRSGMAIAGAAMIALVAIPMEVRAQSGTPSELGYASGVCTKAVLGKRNLTKTCTGKLGSTTYSNGRVGFYFVMSNGGILTFTGLDRPNPTPTTDLTALDGLIVKSPGSNPESFAATGSCTYGDFSAGKRTIRCTGRTDDGMAFDVRFKMTSPPKRLQ